MTETVFAENTGIWAMTFMPVADGIHLPETDGDGWGPGAYSAQVPVIFGASEDEMASFDLESSLDITDTNLREKLLERGGRFDLNISAENVDQVIRVFKKGNLKNDSAAHLFMKMASVGSYLCSGSFYQAQAYSASGNPDVYLYLNRYDAPVPSAPDFYYSWHCMDLAPAFRMNAYEEMEDYSKKIASFYGAFMRTGNPSVKEMTWPSFKNADEMVMIYDTDFHIEQAPLQNERQIIERISGGKIVNPFYQRKVSSIEELMEQHV